MGYKDPVKMLEYQNTWIKSRREQWLRENGPCTKCGSNFNLQVDHVFPELKVSHRIWSMTKSKREVELKKCQVLCEDCHKLKTRMDYRRLVTHCPAGHEYTQENTRIKKGTNKRTCKSCDKEYRRRRRENGKR